MIPEQKPNFEHLIQIKVLLSECYLAEAEFALFLMKCLEKYASGLPVDEMFKAKWFSDRIYALIAKINACDQSPPPDKLPVYRGVGSFLGSRGAGFAAFLTCGGCSKYSTGPHYEFEVSPALEIRPSTTSSHP